MPGSSAGSGISRKEAAAIDKRSLVAPRLGMTEGVAAPRDDTLSRCHSERM